MADYNDIVNCLVDYGAEIKPCQSGEGGIYVKGEKVDVVELLENFFCVKDGTRICSTMLENTRVSKH